MYALIWVSGFLLDEVKHEIPSTTAVEPVNEETNVNVSERSSDTLNQSEDLNGEYGLTARALYDYQAGKFQIH